MIEQCARGGAGRGMDFTGNSLVLEADDALNRGRGAMEDERTKEYAISQFTHAINAINYLTSMSGGTRLVLRAKDILLIAHAERALLEGNTESCEAICRAFPKQTHKSKGKGDKDWYLSQSAFEALFYPLSANTMVGSSNGTMMRIDMRSDTQKNAFQSEEWKKQTALANSTAQEIQTMQLATPNVDGIDSSFDGLDGKYKGVCIHQSSHRAMMTTNIHLGDEIVPSGCIIQFIYSFPTNVAANEYTRLRVENKNIGEEKAPLHAKEDMHLKQKLKTMIEDMNLNEDARKMAVLRGGCGPLTTLSVILAVGNVSTNIFIQSSSTNLDSSCWLVAKAVSYIDQQLQKFRTTDKSSMREAHHGFDMTLCAYCGKGTETLKKCTRCSLARYCSVECQRAHWTMKGPFGHKKFCKRVAEVGHDVIAQEQKVRAFNTFV